MRRTRPTPPAPTRVSERDRLDEWVRGLPVFHGTYLSVETPLTAASLSPRTSLKLVQRRAAGIADRAKLPLLSRVEWAGWGVLSVSGLAAPLLLPQSLSLVVLLPAAGLAVRCARQIRRRPLWLNPLERRDIERARVWQSDRWCLGHWPDEFKLVEAGAVLVRRIGRTAVWRSAYLDGHRLRLDLWQELDTLDRHAWQLYCATRDLGRIPYDPTAQALWRRQDALLGRARGAMLNRLLALKRYADRLADLDRQLADLAALRRIDQTDQQIGDLLTQVAADELAAVKLDDLSDELAAVRCQVTAHLALLRGDYLALATAAR